MEATLISVIIPVYNGGETIRRCLESIFQSSYSSFECIVVDDHSNDNSIDVAKSFETRIIRSERQRGAAYARNRGADAAEGDILLFIDSDVTVEPDSLDKVIKGFQENPSVSALFGSYDDQPEGTNFFSQYKNLFHHYVHQMSRKDASTFWSGCGAIKKEIFVNAGGFDQNLYSKACIEDIELGSRLKGMGYNILLDKGLQVKHLKKWTFLSLLRADILYRAVPWSKLILERGRMLADLNLQISDRISAVLVCLSAVLLPFSLHQPQVLYVIGVMLTAVFALNYRLYRFFFERKGWTFVAPAFVMHLFYYLYSSGSFAVCWGLHYLTGGKTLYGTEIKR